MDTSYRQLVKTFLGISSLLWVLSAVLCILAWESMPYVIAFMTLGFIAYLGWIIFRVTAEYIVLTYPEYGVDKYD